MTNSVAIHYGGINVAEIIAVQLQSVGKSLTALKTADIAPVDAFHIRGRQATLELAEQMNLHPDSQVFDLGSGLGGTGVNGS